MDPVAAKYIGAGIACIGMGGAGVGVDRRDARDRARAHRARGGGTRYPYDSRLMRGFGTPTGHGLVFTDLETTEPDGSIAIRLVGV